VKRLNKVLGLAILIAILILTPLYTTTRGELGTLQIGTQALPITIDGNPSEWGTYDCTGKAPGLYLVTVNGIPQWIWCDPEGDERTDFASPDPRADLLQFRVTADENYLYGLVIVKQMPFNIGDNGGTFVAIAINRNGSTTGETWFAGESDTQVDPSAKWQYQVVLNLADSRYSGQDRTQVTDGLQTNWGGIYYIVDSTWSFQSDPDASIGADVSHSAIEFRVKWSTIGGVPSGGRFFLRISLITARGWSNYIGNGGGTWDIGGSSVSDALDCITYVPGNTWNEVQDQVVNYYIDLYFATAPPYYPIPEPIVVPLLVAGAGGGFVAYLFKARRRK
jgi:hypothetical protein